jgi:hypothetical protein
MLTDGVKSAPGAEEGDAVEVLDIAEMIAASLSGTAS